MLLVKQLCSLRKYLPQDVVYRITINHLLLPHLIRINTKFAPRLLRQDIILLRSLSEKQIKNRIEHCEDEFCYSRNPLLNEKSSRSLFKISRPNGPIQDVEGEYFNLQWYEQQETDIVSPDYRFYRTGHFFDIEDNQRCIPGGCMYSDCYACYPQGRFDFTLFEEQSNWSDIDIVNHIRSSNVNFVIHLEEKHVWAGYRLPSLLTSWERGEGSPPSLGPLPGSLVKLPPLRTSSPGRVVWGKKELIIDDIIQKRIYSFENDLEENVNLLWIPKIGGPGSIHVIYYPPP